MERYQFDATLDGKTCDICGGMDQMDFKMSEYEVGVTAPPIHPRCRCCTVPFFDDWEEFGIRDERAARDSETGKTVYVDGRLNYEDWKSQAFSGKLNETTDKWSKEARRELLMDEEALSVREKETAVVYGPDGRYLFQKRGTGNEVTFTMSEFKRLKGGVVSHNHPAGASLSSQDIVLLQKSGAAEVRASTASGVYFMRSPAVWPKKIHSPDKIIEAYKSIDAEVKVECQDLYNAGKLTKVERFYRRVDETNKRFAERYGLEYGKDEFTP